jgi:hypothetical protein
MEERYHIMQRLMLGGKMPTREELQSDELVAQMLEEAREEGKEQGKAETLKDAKQVIIQALTVEDVDNLPKAIIEKILQTKKNQDSLLQKMAQEKVTLKI